MNLGLATHFDNQSITGPEMISKSCWRKLSIFESRQTSCPFFLERAMFSSKAETIPRWITEHCSHCQGPLYISSILLRHRMKDLNALYKAWEVPAVCRLPKFLFRQGPQNFFFDSLESTDWVLHIIIAVSCLIFRTHTVNSLPEDWLRASAAETKGNVISFVGI